MKLVGQPVYEQAIAEDERNRPFDEERDEGDRGECGEAGLAALNS